MMCASARGRRGALAGTLLAWSRPAVGCRVPRRRPTGSAPGPAERPARGRARSRCAGSRSRSTRVTSSATTTSRARSTGRCRPAGSRSRATPPAPRPTAASPRPPSTSGCATLVKRRLEALGAVVKMTRNVNSQQLLGPLRRRARRVREVVGARLMVSLHADGAASSEPRLPRDRPDPAERRGPPTSPRPSLRLAKRAARRPRRHRRPAVELHRRRHRPRRPLRPRHAEHERRARSR